MTYNWFSIEKNHLELLLLAHLSLIFSHVSILSNDDFYSKVEGNLISGGGGEG